MDDREITLRTVPRQQQARAILVERAARELIAIRALDRLMETAPAGVVAVGEYRVQRVREQEVEYRA